MGDRFLQALPLLFLVCIFRSLQGLNRSPIGVGRTFQARPQIFNDCQRLHRLFLEKHRTVSKSLDAPLLHLFRIVLTESSHQHCTTGCSRQAENRASSRDDRGPTCHTEASCGEGATAHPGQARTRQRGTTQPDHRLTGKSGRDRRSSDGRRPTRRSGHRDSRRTAYHELLIRTRKPAIIRLVGTPQALNRCCIDNVLVNNKDISQPCLRKGEFLFRGVGIKTK